MDSAFLKGYPRLNTVLNEKFMIVLHNLLPKKTQNKTPSMNTYSVFIDITGIGSNRPYTGMDILNSEKVAYKQLELFSGFVRTEYSHLSLHSQHHIIWGHVTAISNFVSQNGIILDTSGLLTFDDDKINKHIKAYKSHFIDIDRRDYYNGWCVVSQDGISRRYQLQRIYDAYGKEFALEVHGFIEKYALTKIDSTLRSSLEQIIMLFDEFACVTDSIEELKYSLNCDNAYYFMHNIYHRFFAKRLANGCQAHAAIKDWSRMVAQYSKCFVEGGLFAEPLHPFVIPKFKKPKEDNKSFPSGGSFTKEEYEQLYGDIPLHIKDEEVVTKIQKRLENEFNHMELALNTYVDEYITNYKSVELLDGHVRMRAYGCQLNKEHDIKTMCGYPNNSLATLKYYGIGQCYHSLTDKLGVVVDGRKFSNYVLGKHNKTEAFSKLYRVNKDFIMAVYILLIMEHPSITPSWLEAWELYDKNGDMVGYKQAGSYWIISSFKKRRGAIQAQQDIILTDRTKYLVDMLMEMTSFERNCLKVQGDNNWRYLHLYASVVKVNIVNKFTGLMFRNTETQGLSRLKKALLIVQYDEGGQEYLSKNEIKTLISILSLRNIRKKKGIYTYLKTRSIQKVSKKLGHKQVNLEVLEAYLPQSLLNFFNDRWVRIFQNSLMFEAMKDSELLNEAFDFDIQHLDQFLENHKIRDFPKHMMEVESITSKEDEDKIRKKLDALVFMISPSLIQMLIAIRTVVEEYHEAVPDNVQYWYTTAVFILSQYECQEKSKRIVNVDSTIDFYERALKQPLDIEKVKRGIFA